MGMYDKYRGRSCTWSPHLWLLYMFRISFVRHPITRKLKGSAESGAANRGMTCHCHLCQTRNDDCLITGFGWED